MKNTDDQERAGAGVRTFEAADLQAVAELFQKKFRDPKRQVPAALTAYLGDVFLNAPRAERDITSLVYTDEDGRICGFIGVLPARLTFEGRPLRAAIAGTLMVDDPAQHPFAGARLLKAYLSGPQDLSLTETANRLSAGMWQRLGHAPIAEYSLDWVRILRPAGFGVAALAHGFGPARLLAPLAGLVDAAGNRIGANPFPPRFGRRSAHEGHDAGDDDLIAFLPEISQQFTVRPDWDEAELRRVLDHAARKSRYGKTFRRIVRDRRGTPVGCSLYYTRPRGIAWVLQVLSRPGSETAVLQDLISHAWENGSVAVRGRTHPRLMTALLGLGSFYFAHSSLIAVAGDPDLLAAVRSGDALVTGLAAETWVRLVGDEFGP